MKSTIISTVALSLLMVGCGGGSGSSSTKTSSSSSVVSSVAPSSIAPSSVASSQASSLAPALTGVFLDGAVANIGYRTLTQQGVTNNSGEFNYRSGERITFFIGNLELPSVLAGGIITPMDIANTQSLTDNQLINILRLLQSLDADGNAANGIVITAAAIAAGATLDFTLAPEAFAQLPAVKSLLVAAGGANKELISTAQAVAHFQTTLEFINGPTSSSSSVVSTSSAASSSDVVVVPGSSASSTPIAESSSSASSTEVVEASSSSASSETSGNTQTVWNIYNANYHPATNGSVTLANGSTTQFTASGTGDYFTALVDGTVTLDTRAAVANTSGATITNVVNADGVYPKTFTLVAGVTGTADSLRVLELEIAMADAGAAGSRLKTILRNDGTNKGVQLEKANNTASVNSYGLNMSTFGIYQIAITLSNATTGSVRVYRDGQLLPNLSLSNVTMNPTGATGDNFLRFGEISGSAAYKSNIDWMVWTNQGAFSPDDLSGELPAGLGCVYGYGGSDNTATCANPPASSSSSAGGTSSSSASSIDYGTAEIRPAKMEGFAAYAGVTGGAGGTVFMVTTGTELNAALCGARNKNKTAPVIIYVNGTINHGNTTAQGCNTQPDVIEIKQTANVSIIGVGTNAVFDQIGIHVRDSSNVIIQNVHVRNVKKSGSPTSNGGDAIGLETDVNGVWIDHNWLEASGGESDGYDSLLDMKSGVTNVTVSYNKYNDSSRAGLVGFTDSDVNNNITFHHNWYKNIQQRTPLIRNALVHVYNNYWSNESITYMYHAINSRAGAHALVESNYFYNVNNPLIASDDSDTAGCWQTNNDNTVSPYIYYSRTVGNGALVVPTVIDGQLQSTCAVTVPYTVDMDPASAVPAIVMANAGVGKIGNGGEASSSSSNSSVASSSGEVSSAISSGDVGGGSSDASSSTSSSVESSSAASSSSVPAIVIVNTLLPITEDFNNVVDAAGFFSTAYKALQTKESPFYYSTGGTPTFANGKITISGARFTLGNTTTGSPTTATDTATFGELDLSKPYRISFCVNASNAVGVLQVYANNTTTSSGTSIHGSASRLYSQSIFDVPVGQRVVINSSVGNANSFVQLRTDSAGSVTIDDLWIGYQADTTGEPTNESCASSVSISSSSVASSAASSSVASSEIGGEGSSSSASSVASSEEASSESSSSSSASNTILLNEAFNVDKATLFSAEYQAISTDTTAARYFATGGGSNITVTNNQLSIAGARFTIGHRPPRTNTLATDTNANGDFDLSRPYRISFNVVSAAGTGKVQVAIDNNTTSGTASMHGGSSRVFDAAANTLTAGQLVEITPTIGTTTSFIAFRTESSTSVVIDNLKLEYLP